jgi:hypothetical protein
MGGDPQELAISREDRDGEEVALTGMVGMRPCEPTVGPTNEPGGRPAHQYANPEAASSRQSLLSVLPVESSRRTGKWPPFVHIWPTSRPGAAGRLVLPGWGPAHRGAPFG